MILDMYRQEKLHVTDTGCPLVLQASLQYWGIDELLIESCCSLKYYPQLDICQNEKIGHDETNKIAVEKMREENFGSSRTSRFRSWVWDTIEYPSTSGSAQLLGIIFHSDVFLILKNDMLNKIIKL